jgi:hypothetical protein
MSTATTEQVLTIGELARRWGVPQQPLRRAVDALGGAGRLGPYRAIPLAMLPAIANRLRELGYRLPANGGEDAA